MEIQSTNNQLRTSTSVPCFSLFNSVLHNFEAQLTFVNISAYSCFYFEMVSEALGLSCLHLGRRLSVVFERTDEVVSENFHKGGYQYFQITKNEIINACCKPKILLLTHRGLEKITLIKRLFRKNMVHNVCNVYVLNLGILL